QVKVLEGEKTALVAKLDWAEMDCHKFVREFILAVVKKLHMSVEYRKSLAIPIGLCFTSGWLGGLSLDTLMEISPNVLPPIDGGIGPSTIDNDDGITTWTSPKVQMVETAIGAPPKTAT
ncbi:hypothetical protein Tco_0295487, partial [Tanacetum coccineum]